MNLFVSFIYKNYVKCTVSAKHFFFSILYTYTKYIMSYAELLLSEEIISIREKQ